MFKNHRDLLSIVLLGIIGVIWGLQGYGTISLPGEVTGATIAIATLVAQFYFRKAGGTDGTTQP